MINIALPKGRLANNISEMLSKAGYLFDGFNSDNRRLIFVDGRQELRAMTVKPSDVGVYVERGVADAGIAGSDILNERKPDVLELLDLRTGICRMSVAAPAGFSDDGVNVLRVATEFPNTAREYYASIGRETDIITLKGSLELAPLTGLSDVIVDIVQTGKTLRENGLKVIAEISEISAWLIVNKSSYIFKHKEISALIKELCEIL